MIAALALAVLAAVQGAPDATIRSVDAGAQSAIESPRQATADNADEFATLWRAHSPRPQPPVDFAKETVVAVFLGMRNTGGYSVQIVAVERQPGGAVVRYRERRPAPDAITAQVITYPFVIVAVPKVSGTVRFERVP
jgi:hypothetical protein